MAADKISVCSESYHYEGQIKSDGLKTKSKTLSLSSLIYQILSDFIRGQTGFRFFLFSGRLQAGKLDQEFLRTDAVEVDNHLLVVAHPLNAADSADPEFDVTDLHTDP